MKNTLKKLIDATLRLAALCFGVALIVQCVSSPPLESAIVSGEPDLTLILFWIFIGGSLVVGAFVPGFIWKCEAFRVATMAIVLLILTLALYAGAVVGIGIASWKLGLPLWAGFLIAGALYVGSEFLIEWIKNQKGEATSKPTLDEPEGLSYESRDPLNPSPTLRDSDHHDSGMNLGEPSGDHPPQRI